MREQISNEQPKPGMATDASGGPVVDPTANVLQLVEAANRRTDDLRTLETKRLDDMRLCESRRIDEVSALRAMYEEKLREAEAKRIDAIRAVDVNAVSVAAERSAAQATVLANQVVQSAETLRALVASTAATAATQFQNLSTQLTDRIAALEKSQYESAGRSGLATPLEASRNIDTTAALSALAAEIKTLRESGKESGGQSMGRTQFWGYLIGAVGLAAGLTALVSRMPR